MSVGALITWPYKAGGRSRRGSPMAGTTVHCMFSELVLGAKYCKSGGLFHRFRYFCVQIIYRWYTRIPFPTFSVGHYNCVIRYCTGVVKKNSGREIFPAVCRAVILDVDFLINVVRTVTA